MFSKKEVKKLSIKIPFLINGNLFPKVSHKEAVYHHYCLTFLSGIYPAVPVLLPRTLFADDITSYEAHTDPIGYM